MRLIRVAVAALLACALQAQPKTDFRARFGSPRAEWFRIQSNIQLRVEYNPSGSLCAARIAPPDYHDDAANPDKNMDSPGVDAVLEAIVPGILSDKNASMLAATMSRNTFVSGQYRGIRLTRHILSTDRKDETTVATLDARPNCLSGPAPPLETQYGPPEYEEFAAPGNVYLGVTYGSHRVITRIDLGPPQSLLPSKDGPPIFNSIAVEQFIDEFAPLESRTGNPSRMQFVSSANRAEVVTYSNVSIMRSYHDGSLIHASVTWK